MVATVMVVGFITAGLMSLSQSIGVIMGANIGTTRRCLPSCCARRAETSATALLVTPM